ncbi:class I SAM-dependent methyltransferase [Cryptosporangium sp. NPDC051539]|uniref:class I SAM-dependent methyltransferase n=1 Tax=Cryptosporangium sp. NPDC051539 TaxID=3363962 RepID=UPI0037887331
MASDVTPSLLAVGAKLAAERGASPAWQEADAENLPFATGSFDVVVSCVGVMFAPHHRATADELIRVARPGGTVGLINWTPEGFIGQLFATMKPFVTSPPGAQPAPRWGTPSYLAELFGDRVTDVSVRRANVRIEAFASGAEFRDYFKTNYGPTINAYRAVDPSRVADLDRALADLGDRGLSDGVMEWEYLLYTARTTSR